MKEILDKYKEICQVLFIEDNEDVDDVLIAKVHRKIDDSINMLTSIFDSEELIIDDLYTVLDTMSLTMRHCLFMFPRTYDGNAVTLTIAMLKAQRGLFENDVLESVPVRELVDKNVVIELVNDRLDAIISMFNHDGPWDESYLNYVGYSLGKNTVHILYKAMEAKYTIREHINIDITHRNKEEDEPDIKSFYICDMRTYEVHKYPLFVRNNGDLVINYDFMEKLLYDDNVLIRIRFGLKGHSCATHTFESKDVQIHVGGTTLTGKILDKYRNTTTCVEIRADDWKQFEWAHVYIKNKNE